MRFSPAKSQTPGMVRCFDHEWPEDIARGKGRRGFVNFALLAAVFVIPPAMFFGFIGIDTLDYTWSAVSLLIYGIVLNRCFIVTETLYIRHGFYAGLAAGLYCLIIGHWWAYESFNNRMHELLYRDRPDYVAVDDWETATSGDTVPQLLQHIYGLDAPGGFLDYARLKAAVGSEVQLRGSARTATYGQILLDYVRQGIFVWIFFIVQTLGVFVASLIATLGGVAMREVELEDIHGLQVEEEQAADEQETRNP